MSSLLRNKHVLKIDNVFIYRWYMPRVELLGRRSQHILLNLWRNCQNDYAICISTSGMCMSASFFTHFFNYASGMLMDIKWYLIVMVSLIGNDVEYIFKLLIGHFFIFSVKYRLKSFVQFNWVIYLFVFCIKLFFFSF